MSDLTVVQLEGDYDIARRDELDQLLDRYGDADRLALDVQAVECMDTSAMRSLVRFQRARREAGLKPFVLINPSQKLRNFMATAELNRTFEIREQT